MKICDTCKTAQRIERSYNAARDGKIYKVLVYSCRNPKCDKFGIEEKVRQEMKITEED